MMTMKQNHFWQVMAMGIALTGCSTSVSDVSEVPPAAQKLPVDVQVVQATPLQQSEIVVGSILPNREVTISSELSKKVSAVLFKDGSHVPKGYALYKLEDAEINARLKQVQSDLHLAQLNEQRLAALLKTEAVRQEEYDIAYARLQSLLASAELLKIELDKTSIRAPFAGKVGITRVHEGALVSAGMPLVTLQEQGAVKIQFSVSEKYVNVLHYGRVISFTTSNTTERFEATISGTEAGIDATTRNMTVYAIAHNASGILKPGMSVRVSFPTVTENTVGFMVPTQALMPSGNGYSVFTVKNGMATTTPVKIGNRTEADALITDGLVQGDTVMISNILRSGEGTPVQVVSAN